MHLIYIYIYNIYVFTNISLLTVCSDSYDSSFPSTNHISFIFFLCVWYPSCFPEEPHRWTRCGPFRKVLKVLKASMTVTRKSWHDFDILDVLGSRCLDYLDVWHLMPHVWGFWGFRNDWNVKHAILFVCSQATLDSHMDSPRFQLTYLDWMGMMGQSHGQSQKSHHHHLPGQESMAIQGSISCHRSDNNFVNRSNISNSICGSYISYPKWS